MSINIKQNEKLWFLWYDKSFKDKIIRHFLQNKVYFHKLPGICTVLNNAEAFVGVLILPYLI